MTAEVLGTIEDGDRSVRPSYQGDSYAVLDQIGQVPPSPYIKKKLEDKERYQTVYFREAGSVAAPTARLHFIKELLGRIWEKGVKIGHVMPHVGSGTFHPVSVDKITDHRMHSGHYWLLQGTAGLINGTRKNGDRVTSVGITSCRMTESVTRKEDCIKGSDGFTDIFIYPEFQFKVLDGLITNFYLLEGTLIILVSALIGREHVLDAYRIAVQEKYRLFSFGDAIFAGDRAE